MTECCPPLRTGNRACAGIYQTGAQMQQLGSFSRQTLSLTRVYGIARNAGLDQFAAF